MNIWLHQAVKSRGAAGGPRNYLAIFFRRLCKLLFFGIKPVFVFDGETPALKRSTMNSRRQLRSLTEAKAEKAQKHLLRRLLRRVAESSVKSLSTSPDKVEYFEDTACSNDNNRMLSEKAGLEYDELAHDYLDAFYSSDKKFSGVDLDSDAFRALPLPAQLRVVQLLREVLDSSSCRNNLVQFDDEAQFNPEQFSDVQMKRLLLRRRLAERQQELSDNLTKQEAVQQILQLITYNTENLNVSDECKKVEISKEDQNKEIPNDGYMSENLCSTQETNISTNENIVYNSECTPIKLVNIEEYSDEHQVSILSHVTDNKSQLNNNCENYNQPLTKNSLNDNMSNDFLPESSSTIPKFDKSSEFIELPISEHSCDLMGVKNDEITAEINVLSSDINESKSLQVPHQDKDDEIKSSSDDNDDDDDDDDFIEVETHEQVEISNTSTDSNSSQEYSVDENNVQNEDKLNSVFTEEELTSKEVSYETNQQKAVLSSELVVDDYTIDDDSDDVLREKADRLMRQAQSTTTRCISEAQDLLHLFGFPFVVSPEEAEAQCVALQRHGLVDLVASDDSDVWPFGVKLVCRHLFGTGGGDNLKRITNPSIYKLDEVKRKLVNVLNIYHNNSEYLGLTIENILRLTLLCGSDYTHGIDQVGPVTAIEILSEFDDGDDYSLNCEINNWLHGVVNEPSEKLLHDILQPLEQFTQNMELGDPREILSSKSLITNFFQIENQKIFQKSEIASHPVDSSELDEVTVPSKRVRQAASRLRNQRTTDRFFKAPSTSQHTALVKDVNNLLSELPKLRQTRRRQSVEKPPEQTKTLPEKKRKEKAQIKPQRRVVERVCLSEEDED
ncbi:DNA excision repair protein ERCC-5 [Schistosoma bovis]|uniref:DNA excision repair protein ERCC-5 n=1 Tax=Schistosoma bovis TaxID=6184 RepID=A0A430QIU7_SCHBO|nr:DNA excision repair protein ERCC-5 [Schistosoma bovis]